ncbi:MAG: sigma-70 family RNA polymerase sigma factor [Nitrospirota bacterium]
MSTSSDDSRLIKDCIDGNEEAWNNFIDRFSKLVYYSISRAVNPYNTNIDAEDIEDIYGQVFLSFIENNYKKLRQFEEGKGCTLSCWVRLISARHTIDYLRKKKRHVSLDNESDAGGMVKDTLRDSSPNVQAHIELSEQVKMMEEAIAELPSSDLLFIDLYYRRELPPEEVADILNITVSSVYSRKNRIQGKIEKILAKKGRIA